MPQIVRGENIVQTPVQLPQTQHFHVLDQRRGEGGLRVRVQLLQCRYHLIRFFEFGRYQHTCQSHQLQSLLGHLKLVQEAVQVAYREVDGDDFEAKLLAELVQVLGEHLPVL